MYGLPGLRFGWVVGAKPRIERMRTLQQYLTLSVSSLGAALGPLVLKSAGKFTRSALLQENRRLLADWAKTQEDVVRLSPSDGGTTVVLEILPSLDEHELFEAFLSMGVLLTPGGRCFGLTDCAWFRLGYGIETTRLKQGLLGITKALTKGRSSEAVLDD